jgi:hypothetical protein
MYIHLILFFITILITTTSLQELEDGWLTLIYHYVMSRPAPGLNKYVSSLSSSQIYCKKGFGSIIFHLVDSVPLGMDPPENGIL